jgi:hypothetical protein
MNSRKKRITILVSLLLVFAMTQVYLTKSLASPQPAPDSSASLPSAQQSVTGVLTTQGNQGITLNGAAATSGATVLSGANIETPAGVGATVNIGGLGSLQIDPNTKLALVFQNGSIRVTLFQGCVVLNTDKGTNGEVDTTEGVVGRSDAAKAGVIKACAPGAVATAPAAAAGPEGLPTAVIVAVFGGAVTLAAITAAGGGGGGGANPSPTTP